ncbi:putative basic proline-rich protein-like isoform X1 [Iris pallida]|uniref:Basic proline-rich protein-like isoform X1 n=1 Tax=Iris pallida TaxID=29817 RepID=A0AAX6GFH4_IRIPA|nr:putative basic proline-rich protein-like isoform X1 [Iris pallida]
MDFRTFRELFCEVGNYLVVISVDYLGWKLFAGIYRRAFPVLGLSRNRGSAAQIFTKIIFLLISKLAFKNDFKTDFRATTVLVCGPRRNTNAPVRPDVEA